MEVTAYLATALVVLAGLLVGISALAATRKAVRDATLRRDAARDAVLRPVVLRLVAGDEIRPDELPEADGRHLVGLALSVLPKLRGEDRAGLVRLLENRGAVEAARRRIYRPGAVGRAQAAELLGAAGVRRALPELARALRDRDPDVRTVAARSLGKLGDPGAVAFLLGGLHPPRALPVSIVSMALVRIGPAGAPGLRAGLADPAPLVRGVAAELLGQFGDVPAAGDLVTLLRRDPDTVVRTRAAGALGRIGDPDAVAPLTALLRDRGAPGGLRAACAAALGAVGPDEPARTALVLGLRDADAGVARMAADALGRDGAAGHAVLRAALDAGGAGADHAREVLTRLAVAHPVAAGVAA